jgi:hypothetical protein
MRWIIEQIKRMQAPMLIAGQRPIDQEAGRSFRAFADISA